MQHLTKSNFYPHQREADLAITREFDLLEDDGREDDDYSMNGDEVFSCDEEEEEEDDENNSSDNQSDNSSDNNQSYVQTKRRKCLVRMFCGTGKSLLMRFATVNESASLIAFVMPSLALMTQFATDYLGKGKHVLKICSDEEGTTDITVIRTFLRQCSTNTKKPFYLCVTYASLPTLIDVLHQEKKKIDVCHFDEAHRAVGTACQSVVFGNDKVIDKHIFYTATPINRNGIVMQAGNEYTGDEYTDNEYTDDDIYKESDCGRTVYTYSYLQAEADQRLNPFHVHIDLYLNEGVQSIYESIARAVFETGNTRVLTFHSSVSLSSVSLMSSVSLKDKEDIEEKEKEGTSVHAFYNLAKMLTAFAKIRAAEFPDHPGFSSIQMGKLDASTKSRTRTSILKKLDDTPDSAVFILASCKTIGEGVDTKRANMVVFVDPKQSYVDITQNIGRMVRKQERPSAVLLPCWVDRRKYESTQGDPVKRDAVIREDMQKGGNFTRILNVLGALKQEDEELAEIMLNQSTQVNSSFDNSFDNTADKNTESFAINPKETNPKTHSSIGIKMHVDSDVFALWSVRSDILCQKAVQCCVIECSITYNEERVSKWYETCDKVELFRIKTGKFPSNSLNIKEEKTMAIWIRNQKTNYNPEGHGQSKERMKTKLVWEKWNQLLDAYPDLTVDHDSKWFIDCEKVESFRIQTGKFPSNSSKIKEEKTMATWISNQKKNYNPAGHGQSKQIMNTNKSVWEKWNQLLDVYPDLTVDRDSKWFNDCEKAESFRIQTGKWPSRCANIKEEKTMSTWLSHQKKNYNPAGPEQSKERMKTKLIWEKWNQLLDAYPDLTIDLDSKWFNDCEKVESFRIKTGKFPSNSSKIKEEKTMANWISRQKTKYNPAGPEQSKERMKTNSVWEKWNQLLDAYPDLTVDSKWFNDCEKVESFRIQTGKFPSNSSKIKEEKTMAQWVSTQKQKYNLAGPGQSKQIMNTNKSVWEKWNQLLDAYPDLTVDRDSKWFNDCEKVESFRIKTGKWPSKRATIKEENPMAKWISHQKTNYNPAGPEQSKERMKTTLIWEKWNQLLDAYPDLTVDHDSKWFNDCEKVESFRIKTGKWPSHRANIQEEKTMANWIHNQKTQHNPAGPEQSKHIMNTNKLVWDKWTQMREKYSPELDKIQRSTASKNATSIRSGSYSECEEVVAEDITSVSYSGDSNTMSDVNELYIEESAPNAIKEYQVETDIKEETDIKDVPLAMTLEEMRAQLEEMQAQLLAYRTANYKKGYQSTNPTAKDDINRIFVQNINVHNEPPSMIVILDHTEFKTARQLFEAGISPSRILIPQYDSAVYAEMVKDPTFGSCVQRKPLLHLLTELTESQTPIAGIYADLTCAFSGGLTHLVAMSSLSLIPGAVIGITICLRNPDGTDYRYADVANLLGAVHEHFPCRKNLIRGQLGENDVYVYGAKSTMATILMK